CTGMIPCAIMDEKQVLCGLPHEHLQEPLITYRVKAAFDALIEQTPRDVFNRPKDFVAFALAAGWHLRLPAAARPGVTQRAPLRKTGFILKQDKTVATLGRTYNHRPFLRKPGQTLGRVEMIRHKTGLLKRKAQ